MMTCWHHSNAEVLRRSKGEISWREEVEEDKVQQAGTGRTLESFCRLDHDGVFQVGPEQIVWRQ